jgi:D-alanine transaminase
MEKISFLNGKFLPHNQCFISIEDRGFQFADSIYEVILFKNNQLIDVNWHLERLFRSLGEMQIKFEENQGKLIDIFLELFKKNGLKEGSIYLQISRGSQARIPDFPKDCKPTIIAITSPIKAPKKQLSVITTKDIRWGRCDIKSTALFASSFAKEKAIKAGFDDAVFIQDEFVAEASFANIFIVDERNNLITPSLKQNILGGITRKRIIDLAGKNGISVIEKSFTKHDLQSANEVFICSSTLLIRPVVKVDDKIIGSGEVGRVTGKMIDLYDDFLYGS